MIRQFVLTTIQKRIARRHAERRKDIAAEAAAGFAIPDEMVTKSQRPWFRDPDMAIGPPEDTHLQRWYVIRRNKFFNVYLHRFLRSDDERALHDHPWSFNFSWLLDGEYDEIKFTNTPNVWKTSKLYWGAGCYNGQLPITRSILRKAGAMVLRIGGAPHRVQLRPKYLFQDFEGDKPKRPIPCGVRPVWTLFITGPVVRPWGFYCPKGWRHSDSFLAMDDKTRHGAGFSVIGRGCD